MQSDNLRRSPYFAYIDDATAESLEYQILQKNVLLRANAYQDYLNRVCKSHTDYSSPDISQGKEECMNRTLNQLAPLIKNVETYYDNVYHAKLNLIGFVDHLKNLDAQTDKMLKEKENREMRFGQGSFFEKYRTYMH